MPSPVNSPRFLSSQPLITFEGVSHAYTHLPSVQDISFRLAAGEILCLLGPSGCGKTTCLRIATGLEPVTAGRVMLGDTLVSTPQHCLPPEKRSVGYVFQDFVLFPHLTVRENIGFGLRRERLSRTGKVRMTACSTAYACEKSPRPTRTNSPAASSSALLWPALWPPPSPAAA